jgi:hypothetical protein
LIEDIHWLTAALFCGIATLKDVKKRAKGIKKLSILCGMFAVASLLLGIFPSEGAVVTQSLALSPTVVGFGCVLFSILHYITMEVDEKLKLQVRPFAYLPFPIAIASLVNLWYN